MDAALKGSLSTTAPDPFVVMTLPGVSVAADDCRRVGLLKGELMRSTASDGSGCCRSTKLQNTQEPLWPSLCCDFPTDRGPIQITVWDDDILTDELIGSAQLEPPSEFAFSGHSSAGLASADVSSSASVQLSGGPCSGSPCSLHASLHRVLPVTPASPADTPAPFVPLGAVEACVLNVHGSGLQQVGRPPRTFPESCRNLPIGSGLPRMDQFSASDWVVQTRFGHEPSTYRARSFRCDASLVDAAISSVDESISNLEGAVTQLAQLSDGAASSYWPHCCRTFYGVFAAPHSLLSFEVYDSDPFSDQLCCSGTVPFLEALGSGPFTVRLSGGDSRYLDAVLRFANPPSPPPPALPPSPPSPPPLPPARPGSGACAEWRRPATGGGESSPRAPPRGCFLAGPPEWGSRPECLVGPFFELVGGRDVLSLPDVHMLPAQPGGWLYEIAAPLSGSVRVQGLNVIRVQSLTLTRIRCAYLEREPLDLSTSLHWADWLTGAGAREAAGEARGWGADSLRVGLHVREMTCTASLSVRQPEGQFTDLLSDAAVSLSLTDLRVASEVSAGFEAHNGTVLLRQGFGDPGCKPRTACSCGLLDAACPFAAVSIGGLEAPIHGSSKPDVQDTSMTCPRHVP